MKTLLMVLLVSSFAVGQDATAKAVEGARLLHSAMRDPESFKISKAWIVSSEKYGEAVCYQFYARNGFGGMNASQAVYSPHTKKDAENGKYLMNIEIENDPVHSAFDSRCGSRALKHDVFLKEVTKEVTEALTASRDLP